MAEVSNGPGFRAVADAGALPLQQLQPPATAFGLGVLAAGAAQGAQALGQAGELISQQALQMQHLVNRADADMASQNHTEEGNQIILEYKKLQGKNPMEQLGAYQQKLEDSRAAQRKALTNPEAQSMFDQDSRRMQALMVGKLQEHAYTESQQYIKQAYQGKVNTLTQQGVLGSPDDYTAMRKELAQHDATYFAQQGYDADTAAGLHIENLSKMATLRAKHILALDGPAAAESFVNNNIGDFGGIEGAINAIDMIHQRAEVENAQRGVDAVLNGGSMPQDVDTAFDMLVTYGEATPDGRASPTGATGVAQVQPATAAYISRKYGIPNDAEHSRDIGKAYFRELTQQFGVLGGMVAYNAGPQVAKDWINGTNSMYWSVAQKKYLPTNPTGVKLGIPNSQNLDQWIAQIPWKETRNYLSRITSHIPKLDESVDVNAQAPQIMNRLQTYAKTAYPDDHRMQNIIVTQGRQQISILEQQQKQQVAAVRDKVADLAMSLDGNGPQTLDDLRKVWPTMDEEVNAVKGLPGGANIVPTIQRVLHRNAIPAMYQMGPEGFARYRDLVGMAATKPAEFVNENLLDEHLPASMVKSLLDKQAAIKRGQMNGGPAQAAIKLSAPYITNLWEYGSKEHQQFIGALTDGIDTFKQMYGRDPTPKEQESMIKEMIVKHGKEYAFQQGTVNFRGIPQNRVHLLIEMLRAEGVTPTSQAVLALWNNSQVKK